MVLSAAALDGLVERSRSLQELVAAEMALGERVDDLLDLGGDDVAAAELGDCRRCGGRCAR